MTRGVLIFAHNNRDVDYALMSIVSGQLAAKYLQVPVYNDTKGPNQI